MGLKKPSSPEFQPTLRSDTTTTATNSTTWPRGGAVWVKWVTNDHHSAKQGIKLVSHGIFPVII